MLSLCVAGTETQRFLHAWQALYQLSHISSPAEYVLAHVVFICLYFQIFLTLRTLMQMLNIKWYKFNLIKHNFSNLVNYIEQFHTSVFWVTNLLCLIFSAEIQEAKAPSPSINRQTSIETDRVTKEFIDFLKTFHKTGQEVYKQTKMFLEAMHYKRVGWD